MKKLMLFTLIILLMSTTIAQNRAVLLQESFDGSSLPAGWSISSNQNNWSVSATNNAGGVANEMKLDWSPQFNGMTRLIMPAVDLTGLSSVVFSFKHALDNYSGSNGIGVATSSDGGNTWNDAWTQSYSTSGAWSVSQEVSTPDMGQANVQFCIYFNGNSYNINDWYFDDIMIFTLENLDLSITSVTLPDFIGSGETSFGVNVFNFGATTVTSVEATYEVEGMDAVTETFSVNIPSLGTSTLNFNTTTLMIPGSYNIVYTLNLVNGQQDDVADNNMFEKSVSVAIGAAEKIPMIEHFSSSTCGPCVSVNTQMLNFCNNNPGRFTYTKYQMNWPGNGDPYYTEEGGVRRTYYGVNAVPQCFLDGEDQGYAAVQQGVFDEHALRTAFMDIRGSFTVEGNIVNVKADIMPYIDADARVFVSVNEKETHNNIGGNGETSFHHIFMKMLPDAQGTSINFTSCENQHLEFTQDMSGTHVEEMSDLEVSIWVQNYNTKEMFNSHFAYEYTSHPYPVENLVLIQDEGSNENTMIAMWNAPSIGNPSGYNVYVNDVLVAANTTDSSYTFHGEYGMFYVVAVVALYGGNKTSIMAVKGMQNNWNGTTNYTINVSANPTNGGTVTGGGTYQQGQSCTVSATPAAGYTFLRWTENGNQVSTNANYTFTVAGNRNLVAQFQQQTYTINVSANPSNGGTVTGGGTYQQGQSCTVSATPAAGFTFLRWTENGDQVSTNANYTFTVTGNRNLVAHFQQQTYTINVSANPSNGGAVMGDGAYHYGDNCTVTATANENEGYTFLRWTENGNQVSTNANYTFTVTGNRNLVAHFQQQTYTITAIADPTNGGEVSGGGTYPAGSTCVLSAMPNDGFVFENWTRNGIVVSTSPNFDFEVNRDGTYVAHFTQDANHCTITAMADPIEGGTVSGDGTFELGFICTLTATAGDGYEFVNWTLNESIISTDTSFSFPVTSNAVYVAHFKRIVNHYTVTVIVEPINDAGSVIGAGTFEEGESCTLIAMPTPPTYSFVSWTENGIVVSTDDHYTFTVDRDRNLVAVFLQGQFYTISATAGDNGTISPEGEVVVMPGEDKDFTMIPNSGYRVQKVVVDGMDVGPVESYKFRSVNGNHSIHVQFSGVGMDDAYDLGLRIYPNPANDKIHIESPNMKRVSIFNLFGVQLGSKEVNDDYTFVNTNDFPHGTYILKVENDDGRIGYSRFVVGK